MPDPFTPITSLTALSARFTALLSRLSSYNPDPLPPQSLNDNHRTSSGDAMEGAGYSAEELERVRELLDGVEGVVEAWEGRSGLAGSGGGRGRCATTLYLSPVVTSLTLLCV